MARRQSSSRRAADTGEAWRSSEAGHGGRDPETQQTTVLPEDAEERAAPPLHGKTHPPDPMDDSTPSLDDEVQLYHRPNDAGTTAFAFDPDAADAAADLAGELGSTFLTGATFGDDVSDVAMTAGDQDENELPLVINFEELEDVEVPARRGSPGGGRERRSHHARR